MMKNKWMLVSVLLGSVLGMGMANAGLVITMKDDEGVTKSMVYQDGVMVHVDKNNKSEFIIDVKKNQCTWLNHTNQKFLQGCHMISDSMGAMEEAGGAIVDKLMDQLTPKQKAMMEQKKNKESSRFEFSVKKVGQTTFQGFAVDKYHFFVKGNPVAEAWLSPDIYKALSKEADVAAIEKILGSDDEHDAYSSRGDILESLTKEIDALAKKENGFVVKSMKLGSNGSLSGARVFDAQLVGVKTKNVDLEQYAIPSGYKEVGSFMELFGFGG